MADNFFKVRKGLIVNGSGSTIFDIQGSQGQLFSVTDNLQGSLFSVNDISGIPIMEVFSDDTVKLGTFNDEAIIVDGNTATIKNLQATGSFTGSFIGDGSQLTNVDADTLDGQNGSYYLDYNNISNPPSIPTVNNNTITIDTLNSLTGGGSFTLNQNSNQTIQIIHPTFNGDDINIDTGVLTGATVISDLDFNITTNTEGHVTDTNGTVSTRNITLSDLGYTGPTNPDNYQYWNLKTNGTQRKQIQSTDNLDIAAGNNVSVGYSAGGVVTINSTDTNTIPNNATITISAGSSLTGGGNFTTDQSSNETITINHGNTSNLGGTYGSTADGTKIDNITVDSNGHVTSITTGNTGDITGVTAGNGLTGGGSAGTVTLNHQDTSTQGSVNNSGGTVIQDIFLDTYGHITNINSVNLDGRYYTETESNNRFVNVAGDTMSGALTITDDVTGMKIDSAGHASIRLDRGSTNFDNNLLYYTAGSLKWRIWMDGADEKLYINDSTGVGNMVTFEKGGNVGIGTTSPDSKLQVIGDIEVGEFGNTVGGKLKLNGSSSSRQSTIYTSNGNLHIDSHDGFSTYLNYFTGVSGTGQNIIFGNGNGGNSGALVQGNGVINATAINTGLGDNELYAMNQNVRTTDNVTFNSISGDGSNLTNVNAELLDGINSNGFMRTGRTISTSPNTISNGGDRYNPNSDNPTNSYYSILTYGNGGNVTGQLATHYSTGATYNRAYNTSWSAWSRMFDDDYHPNADKWTTARTITLGGDLTGNVSIDGSQNVTLNAQVANNSHRHTWGDIDGETSNSVNNWGGLRHQTNDGYIDFGPANSGTAHIYTDRPSFYFNKELKVLGNKVFNDGYHPNADKWTTARTITLGGDLSGNVSIDGSSNVTLNAAVSGRLEMTGVLDMNNQDIYGVDQIFHHGDTNTYMQFHAADQWRVVTGGGERLEVNSFATTVSSNLQIEGNGSTPDNTTNTYNEGLTITGGNMRLVIDTSDVLNGGSYIQTRHSSFSFPNVFYDLNLNPLGGNVGIGTSPNDKLEVNGNIRANRFTDRNNTAYYFDGSNDGDSIRVKGDIVAYYSDIRLKDVEGNIPNPINKIKSLNGFYYTANEKAQKFGYKPNRQVGVSAQDVEAILPEIIKDAPIGKGYKTLDYSKLTPLLIEGIKEQQTTIDKLENENKEQQQQINNLNKRLEKLEKLLS